MIRTDCYLAILKRMQEKNPEAIFLVVTRARQNSILAPSWNLLNDAKAGKIDWREYSRRFHKEIEQCPEALEFLQIIRYIAEKQDVFLVCYEKNAARCHRSLLAKMIQEV